MQGELTAVDVARREKLEEADRLGLTLDVKPVLDLLELASNQSAVRVAFSVSKDEDGLALLPAVLCGKPTRRLRKKHHTEEENDSRDHLESPRNTEGGGGAFDEAAAVGDVEHDHDAPGDGPLLRADETTALGGRSELRDVDRDLGRADAYAEAVDDATDDEHGDVLRRRDDDAPDDPDDGAEHDGLLAAECIGDVTRAERGEPGATGHRGGDPALNIGARALALDGSLVEVAEIVLGSDTLLMLVTASGDRLGE